MFEQIPQATVLETEVSKGQKHESVEATDSHSQKRKMVAWQERVRSGQTGYIRIPKFSIITAIANLLGIPGGLCWTPWIPWNCLQNAILGIVYIWEGQHRTV